MCAACSNSKPPRIEHTFGELIISEVGFEPNLKDQVVSLDDCVKSISSRRPDLVWIIPGRVAIVVEIDENSHVGYSPENEVSKIIEQSDCIRHLHECENSIVFTIRVNPDTYDGARTTIKERAKVVGKIIKQIIKGKISSRDADNILFAYYHSKSCNLMREQAKHFNIMEI